MPGTFSPPPRVSDPDMHFLWNRWRGKRSRHSRRMRNPQFCVSGTSPMYYYCTLQYDVVASWLANGNAAFIWKLRCDWVSCSRQSDCSSNTGHWYVYRGLVSENIGVFIILHSTSCIYVWWCIYIYIHFSWFLCANNHYLCLLFNQLFCVYSTAFAQVVHLFGYE